MFPTGKLLLLKVWKWKYYNGKIKKEPTKITRDVIVKYYVMFWTKPNKLISQFRLVDITDIIVKYYVMFSPWMHVIIIW